MADGLDPGLTKMEISSRGDREEDASRGWSLVARVLMIGSEGHSCLKQGEVSSGGQDGKELTLPGQQFVGFRSRTKGSKEMKDDEEQIISNWASTLIILLVAIQNLSKYTLAAAGNDSFQKPIGWVHGKTLLCQKMLKQLGRSFVVSGLACGGDARTALCGKLCGAENLCKKLQSCFCKLLVLSCNSSFCSSLWSGNAPKLLNKARRVKNISDDAETFNSDIKVKACSALMTPYCIVLQISAQSFWLFLVV